MGTITKALELLNLFSSATPALGLGEFVRLTGRDKATVHRHLVELTENGFLEQHPATRAYRLGPAILRLTAVREATTPMRSVAAPIVEALANDLGELVHFSLLQGARLSPVYHFDPRLHGTQVHFDDAEVLPLHATSSGLAVLAFGPGSLRESVLTGPLPAHASGTITDGPQLRAALDAVRACGFGINEKGFDDEVSSVAAPVTGPEGNVIGALAVAVPVPRMTGTTRSEILRRLPAGVSRITGALGGTVPATILNAWNSGGNNEI